MNPLKRLYRRFSVSRWLVAAVVAWILLLTLLILLDPGAAGA
ncbi:hypothetical protein AB0I81_42485 [Nonomuraea sp. NPDC050404]